MYAAAWDLSVRWLLEDAVFGAGEPPLAAAARRAGHHVQRWQPQWAELLAVDEAPPMGPTGPMEHDEPLMFHGSLELAARLAAAPRWRPGAFCDTARLAHSAWATAVQPHLANPRHRVVTVAQLVADPLRVAGDLAVDGRIFVRPDSPLKPFSGRVVELTGLTAATLDHGFYYDDLELPIVVAPVQALGAEWRVVVAGRHVVTASAYQARGRVALTDPVPAEVTDFAGMLAVELAQAGAQPDPLYVLDVVASPRGLRLLELNPLSGADLYACSADAVVAAVAQACRACPA